MFDGLSAEENNLGFRRDAGTGEGRARTLTAEDDRAAEHWARSAARWC